MLSKPLIVMSAVNLVEGGTLSVAKEVFVAADERSDVRVIGLVNSKALFPAYQRVKLIEMPKPKKSWFCRFYFEMFSCLSLSRRLKANIWFSLHDITPRVLVDRQYVYCHNPTPFYRAGLRDLLFQPTVFVFSMFYRHLYRLNIGANNAVFVQQNHIRDFFLNDFPVEQVVVARPGAAADLPLQRRFEQLGASGERSGKKVRLFYPTLPRSFKNIEVLVKAASLMRQQQFERFDIVVTIDPSDSLYARYLAFLARKIPEIKLIGRISREQVELQYQQCDALVFPSKLETWGLPLTEAKAHGLPILAADLPYAKETLGQYSRVSFFAPDDAQQLADKIRLLADGELAFQGSDFSMPADTPVVNGWDDLIELVINGDVRR